MEIFGRNLEIGSLCIAAASWIGGSIDSSDFLRVDACSVHGVHARWLCRTHREEERRGEERRGEPQEVEKDEAQQR